MAQHADFDGLSQEQRQRLLAAEDSDLLNASGRGCPRLVRLLINQHQIDINATSPDGWNSLMLASYGRHFRTVKILIEGGVTVSAGGRG